MNNRGDKIISVYWFAVLFIVAGAIVYMTVIFYGQPKDVRHIEENSLTNRIADCIVEGGYLKNGILTEGSDFKTNFLKTCNLNFNVEDAYEWKDQNQYYVEVDFHEFNENAPNSFGEKISEISIGNVNLKTASLLESSL